VFVVRKGNPDNIQNWDDLVKPGVEVLTPNPFSSGGARWNLMAAYGAQLEQGKSDAQAQEYLKQLLENVAVQAPSAADSMSAFTQGKGDVALAYENEAIAAQKAGEDVDYVVPDDTILIQTPIATTENASTQAQDFVDWLFTIDKVGGWDEVTTKFFDENNGIVTQMEQDLGVSTSG
jgi:sulfate transport system substrate-binding protein